MSQRDSTVWVLQRVHELPKFQEEPIDKTLAHEG